MSSIMTWAASSSANMSGIALRELARDLEVIQVGNIYAR